MTESTEWTSIPVTKAQKERLDEHRNGQPWGQFLEELRQEHADPLTMNDAEQLAEYLGGRLEGAQEGQESADVDEREIARMVTNDLVSQLPTKIAEELR